MSCSKGSLVRRFAGGGEGKRGYPGTLDPHGDAGGSVALIPVQFSRPATCLASLTLPRVSNLGTCLVYSDTPTFATLAE